MDPSSKMHMLMRSRQTGLPTSTLGAAIREAPLQVARSTLCEEIDEACRCLAGTHPSDADIHGARKALKRARATLKLARDALPRHSYRVDNSTLRDAARPLSEVRDARVLIESLDDLAAREHLEPRESASFREALRQEQRERRRKLAREDPAFERTRASLQAARQRTAPRSSAHTAGPRSATG